MYVDGKRHNKLGKLYRKGSNLLLCALVKFFLNIKGVFVIVSGKVIFHHISRKA